MWNTIYAKILVHDEMQIQIAIIISVNIPYMCMSWREEKKVGKNKAAMNRASNMIYVLGKMRPDEREALCFTAGNTTQVKYTNSRKYT